MTDGKLEVLVDVLDGETIEVRGCDLWTFDDDGKLTRKDSFWKFAS